MHINDKIKKNSGNILDSLNEDDYVELGATNSKIDQTKSLDGKSLKKGSISIKESEQTSKLSLPKIDIQGMNKSKKSEPNIKTEMSRNGLKDSKGSFSKHAFEIHSNRGDHASTNRSPRIDVISNITPLVQPEPRGDRKAATTTHKVSKPSPSFSSKESSKPAGVKKPAEKKKVMTYEDPTGFDMADDILSKLRKEFLEKEPEPPRFEMDKEASEDNLADQILDRVDQSDDHESHLQTLEDQDAKQYFEDIEAEYKDKMAKKSLVEIATTLTKPSTAGNGLKREQNSSKKPSVSAKKETLSPGRSNLSDLRRITQGADYAAKRTDENKSKLVQLREQKLANKFKGKQ